MQGVAEPEAQVHDIVVIGASAGGVETLTTLVADLPHDLRAALFVVLHVAPRGTSVLPGILSRRGGLPAEHAVDRQRIEPARIFVAPPDWHLRLDDGHVRLDAGPRESGHRPAIDALFRSAAETFGPRVIGVILSGMLDDGVLGLRAVRAEGGITVVQDPADALFSAMPKSAIADDEPDYVLPAAQLGRLLARLTGRTTAELERAGAGEQPEPW